MYACGLCQNHIQLSMLVFHHMNYASANKRMTFHYRHISVFVFVMYLCVPYYCHAYLSGSEDVIQYDNNQST